MKRILGVLVCTFWLATVCGQSTKNIVKKQITKRVITEINYADGLNKPMVEEEKTFDANGNVLVLKEFNNDGKIKTWMTYEYDANDDVICEKQLNAKGNVIEKIVYIYKDGLRTEKQYFDAKDRLVKKKMYEYSYN